MLVELILSTRLVLVYRCEEYTLYQVGCDRGSIVKCKQNQSIRIRIDDRPRFTFFQIVLKSDKLS